jgi:hypothetical protein
MTTRLNGLVVAFENDIREDDAQSIIDAILMIKGVASVTTNSVQPDDYIFRSRIKAEIEKALYEAFQKDLGGK